MTVIKSVICALTKGYNEISEYDSLIRRNIAIYELIYKATPTLYDCILFHEGNINKQHQDYIQSTTPNLPITFIDVSIEFDQKLDRNVGKYSKRTSINAGHSSSAFGYKCMCRFWFYGFLKYVNNYKYIMRIDEDCIINKIPQTVLDDMNKNNVHFLTAALCRGFDDGDFAYGLTDCTNDFLLHNSIQYAVDFNCVPYTNFCIIDIDHFKNNKLFIKWANYIEEEGGIFVSRWGDANLWGIFLYFSNIINTNFLEDKRITYYHGSHNRLVNY